MPGSAGFSADLLRHLRAVEKHYARLFEHEPGYLIRAGNLVFTGAADDPETLETLRDMGFRDPALAAETVRGWHFGRRSAVRSARAREVLTELVPALLDAFAKSGDADSGMRALTTALARMPAASELCRSLRSNASLLQFFADVLGGAPRLAQVDRASPHVLDAAIDRASAAPRDRRSRLCARGLAAIIGEAQGLEAFLDAARGFRRRGKFHDRPAAVRGADRAGSGRPAYSRPGGAMVARLSDGGSRTFSRASMARFRAGVRRSGLWASSARAR